MSMVVFRHRPGQGRCDEWHPADVPDVVTWRGEDDASASTLGLETPSGHGPLGSLDYDA